MSVPDVAPTFPTHDPCTCATCARAREILHMRRDTSACPVCNPEVCEHPGVFSRPVNDPGDPVAFNAFEHCYVCDRDVPASEL